MKKWLGRLRTPVCACMLWVALCFGLTSAVYLSWLRRLVALTDGAAADWLSMVWGYLCQALGLGAAALWLERRSEGDQLRPFGWTALLFALFSAPALLSGTAAGAIGFGLLMNLMCGGVAGGYLFTVSAGVRTERRGVVFGGGYAIATAAVGLLALMGKGGALHSQYALLLYLPLTALMVYGARGRLVVAQQAEPDPMERNDLALVCAVALLISLVKNLGFCFPSADIEAGLVPELSRVPYALGLMAAGVIADRDRKSGMLCAVAALILPFLMLGLTGERVPSLICWGLDYLFYAFFSVFRAVLFLDLAAKTRRWSLAPLGLLLGRLGDAAGTGLGLLLADRRVALIALTALLFFPTAWLFYRLYRKLYEPEAVQQRSEQEVFEAFCLRNDLSAREREVLRMVIAEHTNGEIAEALFIAESTVKYHVRNLLQKTGCKNRAELQRKYTLALYPGVGEAR